MRLFTAQQMRAADQEAAEAGVPLIVLMENAGRAVADACLRYWHEAGRILVLSGKGNNGGDGYVAARHLVMAGREVTLLERVSRTDQLSSSESRAARDAYLAHGGVTLPLDEKTVQQALPGHELIVDALFGSGLARELEGDYRSLVETVNAARRPVLSVDVPSGIGSDSGALLGTHVRASRTVQLAGAKRSSVLHPACQAYGQWQVANIGIPVAILDKHADARLLEAGTVGRWLPERARDAHKYKVGTVLVVAGSARYLGAAELACRGALRAGAGLVTLASEERLAGSWPEFIHLPVDWNERALEELAALESRRQQVRVVGPGLDERAQAHLIELIGQQDVPTILDAGALTGGDAWFEATRAHGRCVLTPHAGEAGVLLGRPAAEVSSYPIECARELASQSGAVTLIKGASTVIAEPGGRVAVNIRGHAGMASGGTGDVLAGVIGALVAADADLYERCCAAVYLHGLAGERAAQHVGHGLCAGDIVDWTAPTMVELSRGRQDGGPAPAAL